MAEPRWLSAEEMQAWQAFLAAAALLDRRLDQQLKEDAGLTHPQYEILVRLAAAPGGELRMTDLAGAPCLLSLGRARRGGRADRRGAPAVGAGGARSRRGGSRAAHRRANRAAARCHGGRSGRGGPPPRR